MPAALAAFCSTFAVQPAAHADSTCNVTGSVLTAEGAPVAGVRVSFWNMGGNVYPVTDSDGAFAAAAVCGAGSTHVDWAGGAPIQGLPYAARLSVDTTVVDGATYAFRLPSATTATVRVVDRTGAPIAGMQVGRRGQGEAQANTANALAGGAPMKVFVELFRQPTNANGEVSFRTFADSALLLKAYPAEATGLREREIVLDASTDITKTLKVTRSPQGSVQGRIVDADGFAVRGLQVRSGSSSATVNADGGVNLPTMNDEATVVVTRRREQSGWTVQSTVPDAFELELPVRLDSQDSFELRLPRAYVVTLRITEPSKGKAVKKARLSEWAQDQKPFAVPGLVVEGAAGPVVAKQRMLAPDTDSHGVTVFRSWPLTRADDLMVRGTVDGTTRTARIVDLDVQSHKAIELALGKSSSSPSVYTPPGAATAVTGAVNASTASVQWSPPKSTGGLAVTGYEVSANKGGPTVAVAGSSRTALLLGLYSDNDPSVSVRAVNPIGAGKGAAAKVKVDVAAPTAAIAGPSAGKVKSSSVKVTWKGSDDAAGVATYDVRIRGGKTGKTFGAWSAVATGTTSTSKSLKFGAGKTYCVAVRAQDRVGRVGEWSAERCFSRPA